MSITFSSGSPAWTEPAPATTIESTANDPAAGPVADPFVITSSLTAAIPPRSLVDRVYLGGGKRVLDLVISLALIIVLSPLIALIALWIRLDSPGNALFTQQRIGRHRRTFTVYKFRTMTRSDPDTLVWFVDDDGTRCHKLRKDPRVTRAGAFLRRTSIDELPQLWNVLRGEMSLVGPRPELPDIVGGYQLWQHERHWMRPGLTGWWQVSGRSDKPMHEHTDLDLYYVTHASLKLDAIIAIRTIVVVIRGPGAF